jgi:hypothetical protein
MWDMHKQRKKVDPVIPQYGIRKKKKKQLWYFDQLVIFNFKKQLLESELENLHVINR